MPWSFLQKTCLKSSYSLRTQLLLSFGTSAFLSLSIVVIVSIASLLWAAHIAKSSSNDLMREQVHEHLFRSTYLVAETLTAYMNAMEGTVQLVSEAMTDRIVGYPEEGWEDDLHVPFVDMMDPERRQRSYPLEMPPAPLDWQIVPNVNASNAVEHLGPKRAALFQYLGGIPTSSVSGSYFWQGVCDPSETDPSARAYRLNCTEESNNVQTGGTVAPAPETNAGLHAKSGDLTVFLKALYEAQHDAFLIGIYFVNSGAGAALHYPGFVRSNTVRPYTSIGCDWMLENINPHSGQPFATAAQVARCHPVGTPVPYREYNAMERDWCRQFALAGGEIQWYGPIAAIGAEGFSMLTVGKGVFDRKTGQFIGCIGIDIHQAQVSDKLAQAVIRDDDKLSLVRFGDGSELGGNLRNNDDGPFAVETEFYERFKKFQTAVDFGRQWSPEQVQDAFQSLSLACSHGIMTGYPIPIPPADFDPRYRPKFLALHAVSRDIFQTVHQVEAAIDRDVVGLVLLAAGLAVVGMIVLLCTIWCVAGTLTRPLVWIETVAWRVVNHSASDKADASLAASVRIEEEREGADGEAFRTARCVPRTEIDDLVAQFLAMVQGFSGSGASIVASTEPTSIRNNLTWHSDFINLYAWTRPTGNGRAPNNEAAGENNNDESNNAQSIEAEHGPGVARRVDVCALKAQECESNIATTQPATIVPPPIRRNRSPVVLIDSATDTTANPVSGTHQCKARKHLTEQGFSRLFCWTFVLVVIPLLLTNFAISVVVSREIVTTIPSWVEQLEEASFNLETTFMVNLANAKATFLTLLVYESVRDLYVVTRVAGWLAFGGVPLSRSFSEILSVTDECKLFPRGGCPVNSEKFPCPCEFEDVMGVECTFYNGTDTRNLHKAAFALQATDFDALTGARRKSSFPDVDYSPNATVWWTDGDLSSLPGANRSRVDGVGGYATTYDRLKLAAAVAAVQQIADNYPVQLRRRRHQLSSYMCFDADGLFSGNAVCSAAMSRLSYFSSSEFNRAFEVNRDLCPKGKFGYDCRCRNWYSDGKTSYKEDGKAVHVTAPYLFPGDLTAATVTAPVVNPATGESVGQTLMDFVPMGMKRSLDSVQDKISIVVTSKDDENGANTMIGPNKTAGWENAAVGSLLFVHDDQLDDRRYFESTVLSSMQNGSAGFDQFQRRSAEGVRETMMIAYAPVPEQILLALGPNDFARGTSPSQQLFYSVAFAESEESLHSPFRTIQDAVEADLRAIRVTYDVVAALVTLAFVVITCLISVYVTKPMLELLDIVRKINEGHIEYDLPPLQRGSPREVQRVYNTFVKLYKAVRISNAQFFSRNLSWARQVLSDALELFRKVNDRKACGIACNNLGNTLFAMAQDAEDTLPSSCIGIGCLLCEAQRHFDEAVRIAEEDFESASAESPDKALFAFQLSDRLFNRSLFLLQIDGFDCAPENAREVGYSGMARAKALNYDANEVWLHEKLLLKNSEQYFSRIIRRIYGLASLYDDVGLREQWDVKELVNDADQLLFAAWNEPSAPLFRKVSRIGRLQELEGAAIFLSMKMENELEAAMLAMRMFAEDEFLMECSFLRAAEALLAVTRGCSSSDSVMLSEQASSSARMDISKMLVDCKRVTLNIGRCLVFAIELSTKWEGSALLERINENCLRLYDRHCTTGDYMSIFAYGQQQPSHEVQNLAVELGPKEENEGRQRTLLDIATQSTTGVAYAVFPTAFQMVVDSNASIDRDSFMILIVDGYAWDTDAFSAIRSQIERLNRERTTAIHLFVVGVGLHQDEDNAASRLSLVRSQCTELSTLTKQSLYADATIDTIDKTFESIGSTIAGSVATASPAGITMERF